LPAVTNWNLAVITSPSFAESFRGITPYGTNGFASCGIFGDVRLSTNGTNWQAAVNGQIGQVLSPDQMKAMSDSGFEWGEYLGLEAPWEQLHPPPAQKP